jgi:hypothetical protein
VLMYTDEVVVTSETWEGGVIVTFAKPTSNMHHRIKPLYATVNFNGIPVLPFIVCNEVDMNILPYSMINTYGREEGIKHIVFICHHIIFYWGGFWDYWSPPCWIHFNTCIPSSLYQILVFWLLDETIKVAKYMFELW